MATVINIKGFIIADSDAWIYELFGVDCVSPKKVHAEIDKANGELEVVINSGGGEVFAASEIYEALKSYPHRVVTKVVGLAASAASVIAMAGSKATIAPTGQIMIHNVTTSARGDYRDMEHTAGILKSANDTIANAYRIKTGLSQRDLLKLMDAETWLTPEQALKYGFVDEVLFETKTREEHAQAKLERLKRKAQAV